MPSGLTNDVDMSTPASFIPLQFHFFFFFWYSVIRPVVGLLIIEQQLIHIFLLRGDVSWELESSDMFFSLSVCIMYGLSLTAQRWPLASLLRPRDAERDFESSLYTASDLKSRWRSVSSDMPVASVKLPGICPVTSPRPTVFASNQRSCACGLWWETRSGSVYV